MKITFHYILRYHLCWAHTCRHFDACFESVQCGTTGTFRVFQPSKYFRNVWIVPIYACKNCIFYRQSSDFIAVSNGFINASCLSLGNALPNDIEQHRWRSLRVYKSVTCWNFLRLLHISIRIANVNLLKSHSESYWSMITCSHDERIEDRVYL